MDRVGSDSAQGRRTSSDRVETVRLGQRKLCGCGRGEGGDGDDSVSGHGSDTHSYPGNGSRSHWFVSVSDHTM